MRTFGKTAACIPAAALALLLILPRPAEAQYQWSFQGRVGLAIPLGDLADFQNTGTSFGVGAAYWLNDRFAVRGDIDIDLLSGADANLFGQTVEFADITLYHYNAGIEYDLLPPSESLWKVHLNAGIGATTFSSEDESDQGFSDETDLTINGGGKVGYALSPSIRAFGGLQLFAMFTDDMTWSLPVHVGIRVLMR